ncbi:hypothetical protein IPV08_11205 [Methylobacterium sp. SD274]|uniref:hypothetical protein n=1 Tax=Methylobacterium sp. SD274 TaxID=2782009 RepID=UPI001A95C08D|nr:hypothetical protein [Methylobacterium sp. SD274]MBO1020538.1 hypothetical protein [Methylobacterium sp. SD274]
MRKLSPGTAGLRAIIAMIALYGLCLQAFLGTMAPPAPAGWEGALCGHDAPDDPADASPACAHACCTAAHAGPQAPGQDTAFATVVWQARPAPLPPRPDVVVPAARAPPDQSIGSRGPPSA